MLQPAFMHGIGCLKQYDFVYDILIFPDQLKYTTAFVAAFPDQPFIIDHIAKPGIKNHDIDTWRKDMTALSKYQNVHCKLSGMVTEASWQHWKKDDFKPYIDVIVEAFGLDRILFGSDWPVCLVAGTYEEVVDLVEDYFAAFTKDEQDKVFSANAVRFYKL
jgi:L-fuconolactonase